MRRPSPKPYLAGFALFGAPAVFFMMRNMEAYHLRFLWPSLLVAAAVGAALAAVTALAEYVTRCKQFAGLYVAAGAFWFLQFWYPEAAHVLRGLVDPELGALVAIFALAAVIGRFARFAAMQHAVLLFLAINLGLLAAQSTGRAVAGAAGAAEGQVPVGPVGPDLVQPVASRSTNVYYVIMDGLTSETVLREDFALDLRRPVQRLAREHGFQVAPAARSSYNVTYLTLASIFEQDYSVDEVSAPYRTRAQFFPYILGSADRLPLFANLDRLGYRFTHIGNTWAPCRSRLKVLCLTDHGVQASPLLELLRDYAVQVFFARSWLGVTFAHAGDGLDIPRSVNDNDALRTAMEFIRARPEAIRRHRNFFFIHHMNPHPPARTAECTLREGGNYTREDHDGYRTSAQCAFRRMGEFADVIAEVDPDAIVVFQGDHGAAVNYRIDLPLKQLTSAQLRERFSIFNAVRLPPECRGGVFDAMGNVETINLVLGCLAHRLPAPREPRSYAAFYETHPEFGRVQRVFAPQGPTASAR